MHDSCLDFQSKINGRDAHYSASAEKLLVEAYYDVFVILCETDDFIISVSRCYLRCHPTEISQIFI